MGHGIAMFLSSELVNGLLRPVPSLAVSLSRAAWATRTLSEGWPPDNPRPTARERFVFSILAQEGSLSVDEITVELLCLIRAVASAGWKGRVNGVTSGIETRGQSGSASPGRSLTVKRSLAPGRHPHRSSGLQQQGLAKTRSRHSDFIRRGMKLPFECSYV